MNKIEAQAFVVGGMTVVGVIAAADSLAEGALPPARQVIGYAGACIGLGTVALWSPNLAASLTGLVIVATMFTQTDALWDGIVAVTRPVRGTTTSSSGPRAATSKGLQA